MAMGTSGITSFFSTGSGWGAALGFSSTGGSGTTCFLACILASDLGGGLRGIGGALIGGLSVRGTKPKPSGDPPNRWAPNPGEGGGLKVISGANPGDIGGSEKEAGGNPGDGGGRERVREGNPGEGGGFEKELDDANPESGNAGFKSVLNSNRPNFPLSVSSSFSVQEKLEGADDGPGEMGSRFGVELPRGLVGLLSGDLLVAPGSSLGSGAVSGSFGVRSMLSTDNVTRCCFVGLFPDQMLSPALSSLCFFDISFWKSCKQYINRMLGLIHRLLAWAA